MSRTAQYLRSSLQIRDPAGHNVLPSAGVRRSRLRVRRFLAPVVLSPPAVAVAHPLFRETSVWAPGIASLLCDGLPDGDRTPQRRPNVFLGTTRPALIEPGIGGE